MQINVAQLLKSPIGSTRTYPLDETIKVEECEAAVNGEVTLTRTDRGILVGGVLQAHAQATCSRCLSPFHCPLTLDIEEEFFPRLDIVTGGHLPAPEDPGAFTMDEHHILDLTEALAQYILLAMPMKPLCREDCPGLCPTCGHNLNQGACTCPPGTDPRWAKLFEKQ